MEIQDYQEYLDSKVKREIMVFLDYLDSKAWSVSEVSQENQVCQDYKDPMDCQYVCKLNHKLDYLNQLK